jgi:hypothetical protein
MPIPRRLSAQQRCVARGYSLPHHLHERITQAALRQGCSRSRIVQEAVLDWLHAHGLDGGPGSEDRHR